MSLRSLLRRFIVGSQGIMGINRRNLEFVYLENQRDKFAIVDDKARAKEVMIGVGIPVPETLFLVPERRQIAACLASLADHPAFCMKPARSYGGQGILLARQVAPGEWATLSGHALTLDAIRLHMGMILSGMFALDQVSDSVLVEKLIRDHPVFRTLHGTGGVSDVRTICYRGRIVMAMLRVPTERSGGAANLHAGGIGIGVDLTNGVTTHAVQDGQPVTRHPDTGVEFADIEIPGWSTIVEFSLKMNDYFQMGYLGVDVAVGEGDGPMVLEVNARPGLAVQLANKQGLLSAIEMSQIDGGH